MPMIKKRLEEMFPGKRLNESINPDEAVAYGAALKGARLSNVRMAVSKLAFLLLEENFRKMFRRWRRSRSARCRSHRRDSLRCGVVTDAAKPARRPSGGIHHRSPLSRAVTYVLLLIFLIIIAIRMIFGGGDSYGADVGQREPFIFPLAVPLLAGNGFPFASRGRP